MNERTEGPEVVHRSDHTDMPKFVESWWGWGSPIGISIFFISVAIVAILVRIAIVGTR